MFVIGIRSRYIEIRFDKCEFWWFFIDDNIVVLRLSIKLISEICLK